MENVTIRRATAADAALLAELARRTFYDTFVLDNTPENMNAYLDSAYSPEIQGRELADSAILFLIAEIGGSAVGYAMLRKGKTPACIQGANPIELGRLYSTKDWIGRGIGAALMQATIHEAQQQGHQTLWLGVWERNPRAQAFYSKWSFVVVGQHIFQVGDDAQTDNLMQRSI
jgi:GNAT superfamily N-acetyltransferase